MSEHDAWLRQVLAAWSDDRAATALAWLDRLEGAGVRSRILTLARAEVLSSLRRFDEAQALLDGLDVPTKQRARVLTAQVRAEHHERLGQWDEAVRWREEGARLEPDTTTAWVLLGAVLARCGRLDEAATAHRHATTLPGDPDEAWLNLALVLRAQDQLEGAIDAARTCLKHAPGDAAAQEILQDCEEALRLRSA